MLEHPVINREAAQTAHAIIGDFIKLGWLVLCEVVKYVSA